MLPELLSFSKILLRIVRHKTRFRVAGGIKGAQTDNHTIPVLGFMLHAPVQRAYVRSLRGCLVIWAKTEYWVFQPETGVSV